MKILVTGAAGFIGSHLCAAMVGNHQIIGLDNLCDFYDPEIKKENILNLVNNQYFRFIKADIRDQETLQRIFSENKIDMVIHLAAMAGVRPSLENPYLYEEVNIRGTINLLELCAEYKIKKFIFASSSSVYGNNRKIPFSEDDEVNLPISPYAYTKKAGELICHTYNYLYDISMVCLRFFTVYGPRQRPDLAIHKFAKLILSGQKLPVYGDGSSERDYTYIDDIINGVSLAVDFCKQNKCYEIFNLGESKTISLNKMIATLEEYLAIKAKREYLPLQPGDMFKTSADLSKSQKILKYNPQTGFNEGIIKFVKWLKSNK